jgi:hypothetical protein
MKALIIGTINLKAILNQTLHSPPYINSDPDLDSELNSNLDYLDLYSDLDTEPDMDNELDINTYPNLKLGLKDLELDFKAKEILKDITELRDEGLVKLNYTSYTKKLWKREGKL